VLREAGASEPSCAPVCASQGTRRGAPIQGSEIRPRPLGILFEDLPENIRLHRLPGYSPELNPQEHVWDELREKEFPNRVFESMKAVVSQLEAGHPRMAANTQALRSLTCLALDRKSHLESELEIRRSERDARKLEKFPIWPSRTTQKCRWSSSAGSRIFDRAANWPPPDHYPAIAKGV
jgi:DDE superfamily endonuclease